VASAPELLGPRCGAAIVELDLEYDNLRKALARFASTPDRTADVLLTVASLRRFFGVGHLQDGLAFLNAGLDHSSPDLPFAVETWAAVTAAFFYCYTDVSAARSYAENALQLARRTGDDALAARALGLLAAACHFLGDHAAARIAGEEAVAIARTISHDPTLLGEALIGLALDIDDPKVQKNLEEAVKVTRGCGDLLILALALENLGCVYLARRAPEATAYFLEGQELNEKNGMEGFGCRLNLGWVALDAGDTAAAGRYMCACLQVWEYCGIFLAQAALGLACWHCAEGRCRCDACTFRPRIGRQFDGVPG
jgi:tetratricopeptide (TPR) repeat protein